MPAFMIVTVKVHDRQRFLSDYGAPTADLMERFGGKYVVRAPGAVSLEGGFGEGHSVVVSQWPDRASLDRFWNSPEYRALKAIRQPLADANILVVEQP
jgi:uncharacterized protein (DUF1330 family)